MSRWVDRAASARPTSASMLAVLAAASASAAASSARRRWTKATAPSGEGEHQGDADRRQQAAQPAGGAAGGDDVGVARGPPGIEVLALELGHRSTVGGHRLDRCFETRSPVQVAGSAAALIPGPCRDGKMLELGQPATVGGDPPGEPVPAREQRLMGHLDRRLSRRLIAVDDEQASIDELGDDTTGLRSQLGEPRPTAGVRSALARDDQPGEQLPPRPPARRR